MALIFICNMKNTSHEVSALVCLDTWQYLKPLFKVAESARVRKSKCVFLVGIKTMFYHDLFYNKIFKDLTLMQLLKIWFVTWLILV